LSPERLPQRASATARVREFAFEEADFQALRAQVKALTGITLGDHKRELVYSRLARRLRALQLRSFAEYRARLASDVQEVAELRNAITTNLTAFFREPHHFEYLRERWLPTLSAPGGAPRRLRLWSAGCSSGEEAYSIAMTLLESATALSGWDVRILATDVDSQMLAQARRGRYAPQRMAGISPQRRARFFTAPTGALEDGWTVTPQLAALVTFKELNLMHALPMKGPLDVIFCRNVVIYFDRDTQRDLFARIACLQRPGDLLFLGHSETLFKVNDNYALIGKSIYRRV
jgi:chemotaxis protein methyltransferase CheR